MSTVRNVFFALGFAGLVSLWGSMYFNGTLDAIDKSKASQALPSGRDLMTKITGIPILDGGLATLIAFFDGITNGSVLASHLLMLDLCFVIHCVMIWVMVDGFNLREIDPFVRSPAVWGILWNSVGMAVILPIYCVVRWATPYPKGSGLSIGDAHGLLFSATVSFVPSVLMTLPPIVTWSRKQQQAIIVLFQFTPILFSVTQQMSAAFINQFQYRLEMNPGSRRATRRTYIVAAVTAGLGHFYVFLRALLSGSPAATLAAVFIPKLGALSKFPADQLTAGAHLFTQYDYLITSLTCFFYIYWRLQQELDSEAALSRAYAKSTLLIGVALATIMLGPGATLMFALWAREKYTTAEGNITLEEKARLANLES